MWTLNSWLWSAVAEPLEGLSFYVVITALFVLTAAHFTLLGHRIGQLFAVLPPLRAYGYDLGGSVLGILPGLSRVYRVIVVRLLFLFVLKPSLLGSGL